MDEARPLQIITSENVVTEDSDKPESKFELQKEALSSILSKVPEGMKVSVVSVVGAFRTGKSFLLTLFLRYLRHCDEKSGDGTSWLLAEGDLSEGNKNASDEKNRPERNSFAWRGGQDRMTTGIWMWSEPFIRYSKSAGEKVAILLMDTQGMFDNETTMSVTAQIFGISTLVSSFQIYNVQNSIGEDKLQHLALFSEYGRLALSPSTEDGEFKGEKKSGSDDNDRTAGKEKQGETELSSGAAAMQEIRQAIIDLDNNGAQKPFQHLQFLVRDWSNFEAEWPAEEALTEEMKEYFGTVIKYRDQSDLQSTRDQISRCFDTVNCFLLPHPGTAVTKRTFSGSLDNLSDSNARTSK